MMTVIPALRASRLSIRRVLPTFGLRHTSPCKTLQRLWVHSLERKDITSSHHHAGRMVDLPKDDSLTKLPRTEINNTPLSILPLRMVIRSLFITSISSSTALQSAIIRTLLMLAYAENAILNPDRNPILHLLLKKTFYAQFCAGETPAEVRSTMESLKDIGFSGVILTYAKEAVLSEGEANVTAGYESSKETAHDITSEIEPWTKGTLETIRLAGPGDYVALKLTGSGRLAMENLSQDKGPSPYLKKSMHNICTLAQQRGVRLIFDAEQDAFQKGIDTWTMVFARTYNTAEAATVYGTYQAYRKVTPATISHHLAEAQQGGFTLGVKLVRGAYLGSDPRECFHDTKSETDTCYNTIAADVLRRQWGTSTTGKGAFPNAHMILATHNAESIHQARVICDAGNAKSGIIFAQLQGMADEVSCELIKSNSDAKSVILPAYKYLVWGTTGECMKYLLRRAYENKDAVQRTQSGRNAMWVELVRRGKRAAGFAT
ncbi:proline oxidase [Fusarium avenaceum]|nr:proline oxidase [Fusarium avenaceum]